MSPGKVPKELDRIVDRVLNYDPAKSRQDEVPAPEVETWSVLIENVFANADMRLDATHFDPKTAGAVAGLRKAGLTLIPLLDFASVELRSQFTRIWAQDREHGIPYLNATDLLSLLALGAPAGGMRYLSNATDTNVESLIIHEGWLLMTCSGTIGRVFYVPKRLDGWVATHDLIRIVPKDTGTVGYLHAWLSTPVAQAQILSHAHGGQIDHVTDAQVSGILVPELSDRKVKKINADVIAALASREKAIEALTDVWQEP